MPRRGSARADAIRRAHEAKAARDAARQHREALIESALADYYQAAALAERIRGTARSKCDEVLAEAEPPSPGMPPPSRQFASCASSSAGPPKPRSSAD